MEEEEEEEEKSCENLNDEKVKSKFIEDTF